MSNLGIKFDSGKTQWWYLPFSIVKEVVDVLEYGDKKYPAEDGCNWKRVPDAKKRYYSALIRHVTAWWEGEANDKESGHHHLAHAITNLIFLLWFERNGYPSTNKVAYQTPKPFPAPIRDVKFGTGAPPLNPDDGFSAQWGWTDSR